MTISKSELANNNPASFTELPQNSDITGKHGGRAVKATPHPDKNIPLSYVWTIAAGVLLGLVKVTETAIQQKMCFDASNTRNCTCNTPPPVFNSVLPSILSPTDAPSTDAPSTDAPSTDDLPFLMTILIPLVALCAFSIGIGSVVYKRCRDSAHYADPLRVKIETSPEQQ
nr:hypothetical protein [Endozoicomonas sp.]